jgi:NifU-like protein involved in Fe-S cluster formation
MSDSLEQRVADALKNPKNMGEMAGGPGCGDMVRMWVKFKEGEAGGEKVIEKATFQGFGCETALAVASVATELLQGKTVGQALSMNEQTLSAPLGPLPPMKIHCATLVEEALRQALGAKADAPVEDAPAAQPNQSILEDLNARAKGGARITFLPKKGKS